VVTAARDFEVVYIAGSGRSGSTLVERTLGALPGWVNVGELIQLFRDPTLVEERCGCGESFSTCPLWSEVGRRAYGSWPPDVLKRLGHLQGRVSRQRHLPRLLALRSGSRSKLAGLCHEYAEHYLRIARAVTEVSGARVLVDASKWPGQALALARGGVPVRLVHQIRDPRGVAHSWSKSDVVRPHGRAGSLMASRSPLASAVRWTALQAEIETASRTFRQRAVLRYEDFVVHPSATVARAVADLGLELEAGALDFMGGTDVNLPQSHGLAGNPSRFQVGRISLRADEAWRLSMDRRTQRTVTMATAPLLVRYGYPFVPSHRPNAVES